mmetsp:Transcript_68389/g.189265  ORF Transcript_68389/g.189265 Transcript_68389/m.189265 type:complete len:435 (+) Transcript_68389:72-1376(+)
MAKDPLKVVVRLLPPEITEDELLATINESHIQSTKWRCFQAGKRYKGEAKHSVNSRCYFHFESLERAEDFVKDYHGHQFIDGQGEQFRAVVCFAPYQKVPRPKSQKDPRDGTIMDDPVYKEFLETLSEASKAVYEAPPDPKVLLKPTDYGDTPLLNYMKTRSKERRARAEKKEKKWRREGGLEQIAEEPKKAKWRCAECGTSKHLEEDPDDRGTFYCTYCWESWESQQAPVPKVKKKKKKSKDDEGEVVEEVDEGAAKKKKKKKDKDREAADEPQWRAKERSHGVEEEEEERRHRRKKERDRDRGKDTGADEKEDDGNSGKSNRWRVKKSEAAEESYEQEWDREKPRSKAKGGQKPGQDEWWEEDRSQMRSERRSERPEKADDGRGSRWRAKAPGPSGAAAAEDGTGESEEKPRRNRKEKKGEGSESSYWRPKS